MTHTPPPLPVEPSRASGLSRLSVVWLIPLIALGVALTVAWQTYDDQGPLIEVNFENGAGITAGETELRFRDVTVGIVEDLTFSDDLTEVVALIRVDKDVAPFIDSAASFWIVQPEISARGVTGLDTVLSGVYIEGSWDSDAGTMANSFIGLTDAPLFGANQSGLQIVLRTTPGGSMTDNSPITFRGIEVGRIGKAAISQQGDFAVAEALIYDPHTRLISSATRFWDTTGFTFSVGPSGAEIDFSSVATLLAGGVTFDTFVSGGDRVNDGHVFDVHAGENDARSSLFTETEVETLQVRVVFDENISGLTVDAPVEINGLQIGEVQSVLGVIDAEEFGDSRVRLNVVLAIQPARLGLPEEVTAEAAEEFLYERVINGLRAQLANASLLTGGLKIDLVEAPDAPTDLMTIAEGALPILPTIESDIADAATTVEGVINRVNNLPIEELLSSAITFLDSAEALIANEDLQQTPSDVRALVGDISNIVTSDDAQSLLVNLNSGVTQFETLMTDLQTAQLVDNLIGAIDSVTETSDAVAGSVEGLPDLITQLQVVAAKAETIPLDILSEEITALIAATGDIIDQPATRALPQGLGDALTEINGAVENLNATLGSVSDAADALAGSTEELPALAARMRAVLDQANQTIAGYNQGEALSREAQTALRDISNAADALESLARTLERNPSALIRGR